MRGSSHTEELDPGYGYYYYSAIIDVGDDATQLELTLS